MAFARLVIDDYHIGICEPGKHRRKIKRMVYPDGLTYDSCDECRAIADKIEARKRVEPEDEEC